MTTKFRHNVGVDGTPYQQSTVTLKEHHAYTSSMNKFMVGVVLSVTPADNGSLNRSAISKEDSRGSFSTANVLVIDDNSSDYQVYTNVIIPPTGPSGLDNFRESLPRPSLAFTTGDSFEDSLSGIDPNLLEGDWCIVGFIGNTVDRPFIVSWWPHGVNVFDPATAGLGNVDENGNGTTLKQIRATQNKAHFGRFLQRLNGVEYVVNRRGDIYLSTHYTNSKLKHGTSEPLFGRYNRTLNEELGGSIKVGIKPSQTLELDWNPYVDGIGVRGEPDEDLPQQNPRSTDAAEEERENTYIIVDQSSIEIEVPEALLITTEGEITSESSTVSITTEELTIDASSSVSVNTDETTWSSATSVVVDSPDILLGGSSGGNALIDSRLATDFANLVSPVGVPVGPLDLPTGDPGSNAAAIKGIQTLLKAFSNFLSQDQTTNTKAL